MNNKDFLPKESSSIFSRMAKSVVSRTKSSGVTKFVKNRLEGKPMIPQGIKTFSKNVVNNRLTNNRGTRGVGRGLSLLARKAVGRGGLGVGVLLGAIAMTTVGMMKGGVNASADIVAQRQMQDQRYARNITMMSRLGYTSGTTSSNRYNHTAGLSQALSANRHGRGGY